MFTFFSFVLFCKMYIVIIIQWLVWKFVSNICRQFYLPDLQAVEKQYFYNVS